MDINDRDNFAPKHQGPNIFPNSLFWSRLCRLAYKKHLIAVDDVRYGYTATYHQLVSDVLNVRNTIRQQLDPSTQAQLDQDDEVFISVIGPGGYEFTVSFLAVMALGAVVVPIAPTLPIKEALYFITKSQSVAVVSSKPCFKLGEEIQNNMRQSHNPSFFCFNIAHYLMSKPLPLETILVSSDRYVDMNKPGMVIFTSGTTGPPKAAIKRRGYFVDVATLFCDQCGVREQDLVLHLLPVHHSTGITVTLLPFLWAGGTIEFRSGTFDAKWTWERIKRGNLQYFSGVPTIYMRLMAYYEQNLRSLPENERLQYTEGAGAIRGMLCGTSALPRPLQLKWSAMRAGKPILSRYGLTEAGNAFNITPWHENVPDGSVGTKIAGIDAKLSAYPEGEILIRSPVMFSKYLNDPKATKDSLTEDGYFKTGDIARKDGDFYFILGRASIDIIKSGGYKLSALDIEREILGLDYVEEVMVVGVEDEEYGQRVAAAIVLQPGYTSLTLQKLREDLRGSLVGYKMPTMLKIVKELKRNMTGKVIKKVLVKELFPSQNAQGVQLWEGKGTSKL